MAPRFPGVFRDFGGAGEAAQGRGWAQTSPPPPPPGCGPGSPGSMSLLECPGQSQEVQC